MKSHGVRSAGVPVARPPFAEGPQPAGCPHESGRHKRLLNAPWVALCRPARTTVLLAFALLAGASGAIAQTAAAPAEPKLCSAPEFRQFDFWLGSWDARDVGGTEKVAHIRIEPILGGCVVHEIYEGADGHRGESFSLFVAPRGVWRQTWVTNRGETILLEGALKKGAMDLVGTEELPGGLQRLVHGIWKPVPGGVRETATRSSDGGKTWTPWFDLLFTPPEAASQPHMPRPGGSSR